MFTQKMRMCLLLIVIWAPLIAEWENNKPISTDAIAILDGILNHQPPVKDIINKLGEIHAQPILVGGSVRDLILNIKPKDIDIEVHNIALDDLEKTLAKFGAVDTTGKEFGVLRVKGLDVDWSVPRLEPTETEKGSGRKPKVIFSPTLSVEEAFKRRDLTVNALGVDLITYDFIDPFGGAADTQHKILRAVNTTLFPQDPLRFFRLMQFIARLGAGPDDELNAICKTMSVTGVSRDRAAEEFRKLLLKSPEPSKGINWLHTIERLDDVLPELGTLVKKPSTIEPGTDAFTHTMHSLDRAAKLKYNDQDEKLTYMLAALIHEIAGNFNPATPPDIESATSLIKRIWDKSVLIKTALALAQYGNQPATLVEAKAGAPAYKKLAAKIKEETKNAITMAMLAQFATICLPAEQKSVAETFREKAKELGVLEKPEKPLLDGKALKEFAKGPALGALVKKAYDMQLDEGITNPDELKKRVLTQPKK